MKQDNLNSIKKDSTLKTDVASQTTPAKGTQPQKYVETTEQSSGNQTGNEPVLFLSCSKDSSTYNQNAEQHITTTPDKEMTTPPLTTAIPLIEEGLVNKQTRCISH